VTDEDQLVVGRDRGLAGCETLVPVGGHVGAADAGERGGGRGRAS
jgi:hypothetical protein